MHIEELKENLEFLEDWEERYRYIIELGRELPAFPEALRTEDTKVRGCMSQVWMVPEVEEGEPPRLRFLADSDAHIVKGLIAVLLVIFNDKTPQEILDVDVDTLFQELGLTEHISPNRRNGFFSMVGRIKETAQRLTLAASAQIP
jgi:cysteine desulfuration protein SufE